MFAELADLLEPCQKINIIVANNPDADSLGSALALEEIFIQLDKKVNLYCRSEIPVYLRFLDGWQRFENTFNVDYDLAIMVDNSARKLLGNGEEIEEIVNRLRLKPLIILDHHLSVSDIDFAELIINQPQMAATGQLIYAIAKELAWPLNETSAAFLAASILSDSLGFTSQIMVKNSEPLRVVAELVDLGVNLSDLAQKRLKWQELPVGLIPYRGELLKRIEFYGQDQIALLTIEYEEIKKLGSLFNPTVILDEMRAVENVRLSLGFKKYKNQLNQLFRVTLRIRCHRNCQIAQSLAETFGGGGHPYAAGAKWEADSLDFDKIKDDVLKTAIDLLSK